MGLRRGLAVALSLTGCSAGRGRVDTGTSVGVDDATGTGGTTSAGDADTDGGSAEAGPDTTSADSAEVTGTDATSDGSSDGTALPCDQDLASCDAWFLPRSAEAWEAVRIGGPAALAPSSPVLAAFDIEAERIAFVVTIDEVIEVDLESRAWVAKTSLADRFPEINAPVLSAYSIPAYWGGMPGAPEGITIAGSDVAFLYEYDAGNDTFTYDQSTVFGTEWDAPGAPAGADVRAMWLDVTNADGWVDNDLSELCDTGSGPVGPYLAVVTDEQIHAMDVGTCSGFFPGVPYGQFAATALDGAPPSDRIGGAAYNETTGLVVFAGE